MPIRRISKCCCHRTSSRGNLFGRLVVARVEVDTSDGGDVLPRRLLLQVLGHVKERLHLILHRAVLAERGDVRERNSEGKAPPLNATTVDLRMYT